METCTDHDDFGRAWLTRYFDLYCQRPIYFYNCSQDEDSYAICTPFFSVGTTDGDKTDYCCLPQVRQKKAWKGVESVLAKRATIITILYNILAKPVQHANSVRNMPRKWQT
jgi:hypothetical protein